MTTGLSVRVTLVRGLEACAKIRLWGNAVPACGEVEENTSVKMNLVRPAIQSRARILFKVREISVK